MDAPVLSIRISQGLCSPARVPRQNESRSRVRESRRQTDRCVSNQHLTGLISVGLPGSAWPTRKQSGMSLHTFSQSLTDFLRVFQLFLACLALTRQEKGLVKTNHFLYHCEGNDYCKQT
jgi:hypothetical protein